MRRRVNEGRSATQAAWRIAEHAPGRRTLPAWRGSGEAELCERRQCDSSHDACFKVFKPGDRERSLFFFSFRKEKMSRIGSTQ